MDDFFIDTLRLIRTENIGPITFYKLIKQFGSAKNALEALPELSKKGGRKKPLIPVSIEKIEKEIKQSEKQNIRLLPYYNENYPILLKTQEDAPPIITYKGNIETFKNPSISIVGSRNSSLHAKKFTYNLSKELNSEGFTITSGMAYGIDTSAHKGALVNKTDKKNNTIAVLAGGIDYIYPKENQGLYYEIIENGCVVSEMPVGSTPQAQHFPRRNRIISALSIGTVITEAGLKSGSLITARLTLEQSRDLFAIPGFPTDPRSKGTNKLIKNGEAYLTENADDILKTIKENPLLRLYSKEKTKNLINDNLKFEENMNNEKQDLISKDETKIEKIKNYLLENLSTIPISVNEILREANCSNSELSWAILELELAGKIIRMPGNKIYKV